MRKIIEMKHHLDDYECMWNGIEDLYINKTDESLPPNFFFVLSSFGSFCYMKTNKAELKRMAALGDGRTKNMYEFLAPIAGFDYKHYSYKTFRQAIKKAKAEIDSGHPVVLGALDMYYLKYFKKLYHKEHIPFHYVLMAGYDDEQQKIYLYDCGRCDMQDISYDELALAWNCEYPGLSKPNTLCTVRMNSDKDKYSIAKEAFKARGEQFLNPPVGFIGCRGFEKFIRELPKWKEELSKEDYDKILFNMVQFFGTVPTVPNKLLGIDEPDGVDFCGGFDKMSRVLYDMGCEYSNEEWVHAADVFKEGASIISVIKDVIVDYLTGSCDRTASLPEFFGEVLQIMIDGYSILLKND